MGALIDYLSVDGNQGVIIAIATIVMAITAVITTFLTLGLFRENRFLRKAGTEPEVVACLMIDPRYRTSLNFVLVNIGQGPALNISFSIDCDETDFSSHDVRLRNTSSQSPIGLLTQGGQVATYFGGHLLFGEHKLHPFTVTVRYEDIKGRKRSRTSTLDVSQFEGFGLLGSPAEHEMAEALKKIEAHLSQFKSGFNRLKVEMITTDQVRKEEDQARKKYEEWTKEVKAETENNTQEN